MSPKPFPLPSEVFTQVRTPANVQRADWLDRMRVTRWCQRLHARLKHRALAGRDHVGRFVYRAGQGERTVEFDGRNAQFHALYEPAFRAGYEAETAFLLLRLARDDAVFYDIGANWGYFSLLLAASAAYRGRIFSFEPNPQPFADLTRTIAAAGQAGRITAVPKGVGRAPGELRVAMPDAFHTGLGHLSADGTGARVPVVSIDGLDLPPPDIIKIDAEGMETEILEGAAQTIAARRPHIVFESFRDFLRPDATRAPLQFLLDRGYQLFNPALAFAAPTGVVLAGYDAPQPELLAREPRPRTARIPVS